MGVDSVADYCEVCYDMLDDGYPHNRCEDCRAFADQEWDDGEELPEDSGEDHPLPL